jgi:hypothetical protein
LWHSLSPRPLAPRCPFLLVPCNVRGCFWHTIPFSFSFLTFWRSGDASARFFLYWLSLSAVTCFRCIAGDSR